MLHISELYDTKETFITKFKHIVNTYMAVNMNLNVGSESYVIPLTP